MVTWAGRSITPGDGVDGKVIGGPGSINRDGTGAPPVMKGGWKGESREFLQDQFMELESRSKRRKGWVSNISIHISEQKDRIAAGTFGSDEGAQVF